MFCPCVNMLISMFTYRILRGKYHLTWIILLYLVQISHTCRINLSKDAGIGTEDVLVEFLTEDVWPTTPEWQNCYLWIGLFAACTIRAFTCLFIKWQLCISWEMFVFPVLRDGQLPSSLPIYTCNILHNV